MIKNMLDNINPNKIMDNVNEFNKKIDKNIKSAFRGDIQGSFLIKVLHKVFDLFPDFSNYYSDITFSDLFLNNIPAIDYDIAKIIIGIHKFNNVFLSQNEIKNNEKDAQYINKLVRDAIDEIKLRRYGSMYFRNRNILLGDNFIYYKVPYESFVMCMKLYEILSQNNKNYIGSSICYKVMEKTLAALTLFADNFLNESYSICRGVLEQVFKLCVCKDNEDAYDMINKFARVELGKTNCGEEYPEWFNELYKNRKFQNENSKLNYLHYGWVDLLNDYEENIFNSKHYSMEGLLEYLENTNENYQDVYCLLEALYKECHGYIHGSVPNSIYPLLHYLEISIMLSISIKIVYEYVCNQLGIETSIDNIDILEKSNTDIQLLINQYYKRGTDAFKEYYQINSKYKLN